MIRYLTIAGQKLPARFSLRAAINVTERYGSAAQALFDDSADTAELLRRRCHVLSEMLQAGSVAAAIETGCQQAAPPSEEELLDLISMAAWNELFPAMLQVINEDDRSDFGAEATGKNAEATSGL
jgi:hypothetical protein